MKKQDMMNLQSVTCMDAIKTGKRASRLKKKIGIGLSGAVLGMSIFGTCSWCCAETVSAQEKTLFAAEQTEEVVFVWEGSYMLRVGAAVSIFAGPGYDYEFVRAVGLDGVYTIVEEMPDEEGNYWGRLKSGIGWINLTDVQMRESEQLPVTANYAVEELLEEGSYEEFWTDDSEYITKIAFWASEEVKDVKLTALEFEGSSYKETQTLYTMDVLTPERPLVAGVVYYGDATAYGISFTDSSNEVYCYAVTISGRNGSLVFERY